MMADGDLYIHVTVTVDNAQTTISTGGSAGAVRPLPSAGSIEKATAGSVT